MKVSNGCEILNEEDSESVFKNLYKTQLGKKNILKESSKIGKVASKNISLFLIVSAVQYLRKADAVVLKQ